MITRGRFIFSGAPTRLRLFELVDGRRSTQRLATTLRRHPNNIRRDLTKIENAGLIQPKLTKDTGPPTYEKVPLARTIPTHYFLGGGPPSPRNSGRNDIPENRPSRGTKRQRPVAPPTEHEILDICKDGEDQAYEFKAAGTDVRKLAREACAMLNTKSGGIIFYGIDDDGTISGTDVPRQKLDQPLQNSIKNSISPAATIALKTVRVMGTDVILILVPPWNRRDVFQFDEKVLLRKGTNVFAAKPEELKKLHQGRPVV